MTGEAEMEKHLVSDVGGARQLTNECLQFAELNYSHIRIL
jgi:hypothetical protein